jgi:hypothetical protein
MLTQNPVMRARALLQGPNFKYLAGLQGLQHFESMWDMRPDVIQILPIAASDVRAAPSRRFLSGNRNGLTSIILFTVYTL